MTNSTNIVVALPLLEVSAPASDVVSRLPEMGNLMVIGRNNGVTLERIGPVEHVGFADGMHRIGGGCHDASVTDAAITRITLNPGREIGGNIYPRIEFENSDGNIIMAWVGMSGGPAFLEPLADLHRTDIGVAPKTGFDFPKENFPIEDPGYAPFHAAFERQAEIGIRYDRNGFVQQWRGVIPSLNPSRGFLNIMTDDFHLHLRIGAVSAWYKDGINCIALGEDQKPNGLILQSGVFA